MPVDAAFQRQLTQSTSVLRKSQSEFENQLLEMFIEDMQPMATIERSGFRKFCDTFLPRYTLPSRRTLNRRLADMYKTEKTQLIALLANKKMGFCNCRHMVCSQAILLGSYGPLC